MARSIGPLQLYNAAVADLRAYITLNDKPSRLDVLLSCAALICCDLMRGDCNQATKHVDHGSAVVRAWQQEVMSRPAVDRLDHEFKEIAEVFFSFDLHATTFDDSRVPLLAIWQKDEVMGSSLPTRFTNLQQAQRWLVQVQSAAFLDLIQSAPHKFQQLSKVPAYYVQRRRLTRASFEGWSSALARLETDWTRSALVHSRKEQAALLVLRIHHRTLQLLLDESLQEGDIRQPFDEAGDQLLRWAEQALQLLPPRHSFSIDVGLGPSLFLLVLKTTKISIRQRGKALLACVQQLEGWHRPQAMLQAVNNLTTLQAYGEAVLSENMAGMTLEQVAAQAGEYTNGVEQSTWLDASLVTKTDAVQ